MKLLVIEDDPTSLKLAGAILVAVGHVVRVAINAKQALASIREEKPDAIFLDLELPEMNGLELVRELKKSRKTQNIPIVAVTAHTRTFPEEMVLAAGCDAYLVKPINTRTLAKTIAEVVARKNKVEYENSRR